jgi:acetyltransferase-like isoleucine patch superfamily enzyme
LTVFLLLALSIPFSSDSNCFLRRLLTNSQMTDKITPIEKKPLLDQLHKGGPLGFTKYKRKATGDLSFFRLGLYECFALLFANLGGALGYIIRKAAAKYLFQSVGTGLILGRGLVVRHPSRISLGANVAIDDGVFLDGSGSGEIGVQLRDGVVLSRNCIVLGKNGHIVLSERVDVGFNCVFASVSGITIGASTIIAGNCYIGGGRYHHDQLDQAIMDQGAYSRGEIIIGENSWIGAGAIILDGVKLGKGVIVGAGSVVTKDAPDYAVLAGTPARILHMRGEQINKDGVNIDAN